MVLNKITVQRLSKQERKMLNEPIPNVWVHREGLLTFHFCIYGLDEPYKDGYYHGALKLPEDYPFSPPSLRFFTPSGRFAVNTSICTTFTNFHKETWSSGWNVESMLKATVSFMTGQETGIGSFNLSTYQKTKYAKNSLANNLQSQLFRSMFQHKIDPNIFSQTVKISKNKQNKLNKEEDSNVFYQLILILLIVLALWVFINNGEEI